MWTTGVLLVLTHCHMFPHAIFIMSPRSTFEVMCLFENNTWNHREGLRDGQRLQNLRQPQIPHLAGPSTCGWKWVVPYMRCFIIIVSISNNVKCCFIAETPTLSYLHPTSNPSLERTMIFGSQGPRRTARPHREDGTGWKIRSHEMCKRKHMDISMGTLWENIWWKIMGKKL